MYSDKVELNRIPEIQLIMKKEAFALQKVAWIEFKLLLRPKEVTSAEALEATS